MKALEYYVPGINLSEIDRNKLTAFAEKHNDRFIVENAETADEKTIQMTFIRVVDIETEIRFHMLETEDGNYAVYLPDAWHALPYDQLWEAVYPYLCELLPTYARNFEFESVMVSVSCD